MALEALQGQLVRRKPIQLATQVFNLHLVAIVHLSKLALVLQVHPFFGGLQELDPLNDTLVCHQGVAQHLFHLVKYLALVIHLVVQFEQFPPL